MDVSIRFEDVRKVIKEPSQGQVATNGEHQYLKLMHSHNGSVHPTLFFPDENVKT